MATKEANGDEGVKMKLLLGSIFGGLLISSILYMAFAISAAVLIIINEYGGFDYVVGFIFLVSVTIFSTILYHQDKRERS